MKDNLYIICYAAILGLVCALLLTGVAQFTAPYQEQNRKAEKNRNLFVALDIEFDEKASAEELVEIFDKNIKEQENRETGMTLYRYENQAGALQGIAVNFEGPGLWGPIKGFLALKPDMKTIKGITFYEQEETPGLGGEISTEAFRSGFFDKKIVDSEGKPGIVIKAGLVDPADNEIDGISGATLTIDKVSEMLNDVIVRLAN